MNGKAAQHRPAPEERIDARIEALRWDLRVHRAMVRRSAPGVCTIANRRQTIQGTPAHRPAAAIGALAYGQEIGSPTMLYTIAVELLLPTSRPRCWLGAGRRVRALAAHRAHGSITRQRFPARKPISRPAAAAMPTAVHGLPRM